MLGVIGKLVLFDGFNAKLQECKVVMSSCRLAGVWFEDEVVEVVMVQFLSS